MSSGSPSSSSNNNNRSGRPGQQRPETSQGPQPPTKVYQVESPSGIVKVMEWEGDALQQILQWGWVRVPRSNPSDPVRYVQGCRAPAIFANPNSLPLMINAIRPDGSIAYVGNSLTFGRDELGPSSNRGEISAKLRIYKLVVEVDPGPPHTARSSYLVKVWTTPEDIGRSIRVRRPTR